MLWEDVSEGELVEGKFRNGLVSVDDSGIALSSNIRAVAADNLSGVDVDVLFVVVVVVFLFVVVFFLVFGEVGMDVLLLFLLLGLSVELVVLWVVNGVSVVILSDWLEEFIWGEEVTELVVDFLLDDVGVVVLVLGDVWVVARGVPVNWLGDEWSWLVEVDSSATVVVEVVVPVSGCWVECWVWHNVGVAGVVFIASHIVVLKVIDVVLDVVLVVDLFVVDITVIRRSLVRGDGANDGMDLLVRFFVIVVTLVVNWLVVDWLVVYWLVVHWLVMAVVLSWGWSVKGRVVVGLVNVDGAGNSSEVESGSE